MRGQSRKLEKDHVSVPLPIWQELMVGVEITFLHLSPIFWGYGIPHGDGSGVVLVPAFLATDLYLTQFRSWLRRIGYKPYYSGIARNDECPNLLIRQNVTQAIQEAYESTGRKIHLIGHSLGGTIARAVASQMSDCVASVITLGAPIQGLAAHASILRTAELIRKRILKRHGPSVLPDCYTARCTCAFLESLKSDLPRSVRQTAIYTKTDAILDWHVCCTGDPSVDLAVSATHIGLAFNPLVYSLVAQRLAGK